MKKCPKCGKEHDDGWKVCLQCNTELCGENNKKVIGNEDAQKPKGNLELLHLGMIALILVFPLFGGIFALAITYLARKRVINSGKKQILDTWLTKICFAIIIIFGIGQIIIVLSLLLIGFLKRVGI